jgi:hypothetical protein
MSQASDAGLCIVKQNGNTAAEALGDQDVVGGPHPEICHPHYELAAVHALSR